MGKLWVMVVDSGWCGVRRPIMRQAGAGLYFDSFSYYHPSIAMRVLALILLSTFLFGFVSCGQKGPLTLPEHQQAETKD